MRPDTKLKNTAKQHTVYKTLDGKRVPGVTTIIGVLAKPALIYWANQMGLQGVDTAKYTDATARVGTLAHYLVMCHMKKEEPDAEYLKEFSKMEMDIAENSLISFYEWEQHHEIKPIENELPLVHEELCYGGTIDVYAEVDGLLSLVDLKTGKGLYDEHSIQLAAYRKLLMSHGYIVDRGLLLNIPRQETEEFQYKEVRNFEIYEKIFWHCHGIYNLQKQLKGY
jgi:hypothetical protein